MNLNLLKSPDAVRDVSYAKAVNDSLQGLTQLEEPGLGLRGTDYSGQGSRMLHMAASP